MITILHGWKSHQGWIQHTPSSSLKPPKQPPCMAATHPPLGTSQSQLHTGKPISLQAGGAAFWGPHVNPPQAS